MTIPDPETEYEKKIGELQEKTFECGKLAQEIYFMIKDKDEHNAIMSTGILEQIIEDCRKAARKVGWIDTRS